MIDELTQALLSFWLERLAIRKPFVFKYVPRSRWDGAMGKHQFGIIKETGEFIYSKRPSEADIVHELTHYAFPELSERYVRRLTKALLY